MSSLGKSVQDCMTRIIFYQMLIIMGFVLAVFLLKGMKNGLSALGGAWAYYVPTCLFIWRLSLQTGARLAVRFAALLCVGEAIKLLLSGLIFLLLVKHLHVNLMFALFGLAAAILGFWIASMMVILKTGVRYE